MLNKDETLLAKELKVASGSIGEGGGKVVDAYDLYLVEKDSGKLALIVFMKVQFLFHDYGNEEWTEEDEDSYVASFESIINKVWGNHRPLQEYYNNEAISLDIRFKSVVNRWSFNENWEVHVTKIGKNEFKRSHLNPTTGKVTLDSEDVRLIEREMNIGQRGIVHEFGHMLGLPDDYTETSPYFHDVASVMHSGEVVRPRHDRVFSLWLKKELKRVVKTRESNF